MNLLIKSAKIIDINSKHHNKIMDVFIKNGKIENIDMWKVESVIIFLQKVMSTCYRVDSSLKKKYVIRYLDSLAKGNICHSAFINNKIRKDKGDLKLEKVESFTGTPINEYLKKLSKEIR